MLASPYYCKQLSFCMCAVCRRALIIVNNFLSVCVQYVGDPLLLYPTFLLYVRSMSASPYYCIQLSFCMCAVCWRALTIVSNFLSVCVQYVGEPIQCLCPAQLTEAQCNYTKALCWVKHNYFVHEVRQRKSIYIIQIDK